MTEKQNRAERVSRALALLALSHALLETALDWRALILNPDSFLALHAPSLHVRTTWSTFALLLVDALVRRFQLLLPAQLSVALFAVMARALCDRFLDFNHGLQEATDRELDARQLRLLRARRCDLHDALLELDRMFAPLVLVSQCHH